jgi:hypothetical protein
VDPEEYRRKFRVLDMMLSGHATLRERNRRRWLALTLAVMLLSILAATLALAEEKPVEVIFIRLQMKDWLAILAGLIFFLSIIELVIDWRGRVWAHGDAARRLAELKGQFRRAEISSEGVETNGVDLDEAYDQAMAAIVEIPNSLFNRLKAKHRRKVAVSKLLDESPGAPLLLLRWRVFRAGVARRSPTAKSAGVLEESPPARPGADRR